MTSPERLERLAAYVPTPVAQAIYRQPQILTEPRDQRYPAAVLFSDISGFTALSELLSERGTSGAEELTALINQYFTQMIQIIQDHQGQVVKFSGDALTVIFPAQVELLSYAVRQASQCALAMQAQMADFKDILTSQGAATLSMKVGIGAGILFECAIGGVLERWEYIVGGEPLVQVALAEKRANPGEIILSPEAWHEAQPFLVGSIEPQNFFRLHQLRKPLPLTASPELDWAGLAADQQGLAETALQRFVPGAIKARLYEQADWLAELRHMTVVFVGIGGFNYESPQVKDQIQTFLRATQEVIYSLEGSLGKLAVDDKGTVMLILFGAPPFSHEDDTQRAVNCALGLQRIAQEQGLHMAIGITEGSLFAGPVGAPSRREYTVIGDEVNLAARLMQYGRAGSIIVSERVYRRIEANFSIESLGELSLKGKSSALRAYLVKGEEGAQFQFVTRYFSAETPLIGRKSELEQIRRIVARTRDKKPQVLFIEGELGLGKSRLASEMVREWITMEGGAAYGSKSSSYARQLPYQGWHAILADIYGLNPNLTAQQKLERLNNAITDLPNPPDQPGYWQERLPLLADILNLECPNSKFTAAISGKLRRNNTFALVEALLRRQVEHQPMLILLEDTHWADELTIALAAHLARTLVNTRLLLVFVHRPLSEEKKDWLAELKNLPNAHTIYLEPLSADESLDLINVILGEKQLPVKARNILMSRAQGNPFFLQEIAKTILDGLDRQTDQPLKLTEAFDLPGSLQDAILTRVDRLPESEKLTLKVASVIGSSFERSVLSAVHPLASDSQELSIQLADLESQNLIRLESSAPQWRYTFHNVITHEVVYEGLLLMQRRQLHTAVGEILEQFFPGEIEQLAYHFSRSNNQERGINYLTIAAQKARREYANQVAIEYYSQILTCLTAKPIETNGKGDGSPAPPSTGKLKSRFLSTEYWDVLLQRARLYNLIGWRDEELEDLGTLGLLAEGLNDDRRRALAAREWANFYEKTGDYDSGLELIERSAQLAQTAQDEQLTGKAFNKWGNLLYLRGDYQNARGYLERAFEIAQKYDDRRAQADCLNTQGTVAFYQTDYQAARNFLEQAIIFWRDLGDQTGLGGSLRNLGRVYYKLGQYIAARNCYNQSLSIHRTIGDWVGEAQTKHYLGQVEHTLGNYVAAKMLLEEALTMYQAVDDHRGYAHCLAQLGFLYYRVDDHPTAIDLLEKALIIFRELDDPWGLADTLTYYGWVLTTADRNHKARTYLQEALQIERDIKHGTDQAAIVENLSLLGRVALTRNDLSLADTCAQHAFAFAESQSVHGIKHPVMVFLTCYEIFKANKRNEQAERILGLGQAYLAAQAAQIDDPAARQVYLTNIPENRALHALAHNYQTLNL